MRAIKAKIRRFASLIYFLFLPLFNSAKKFTRRAKTINEPCSVSTAVSSHPLTHDPIPPSTKTIDIYVRGVSCDHVDFHHSDVNILVNFRSLPKNLVKKKTFLATADVKALRTYLKLSCDRPKYQFDHNLPVIFVVRNINSIEEALNLIARGSSFSINEVSDRINKDLFIFVARSDYGIDGCSLLETVIFAREKSKNINIFGLDYYLEKPIQVKGIILPWIYFVWIGYKSDRVTLSRYVYDTAVSLLFFSRMLNDSRFSFDISGHSHSYLQNSNFLKLLENNVLFRRYEKASDL